MPVRSNGKEAAPLSDYEICFMHAASFDQPLIAGDAIRWAGAEVWRVEEVDEERALPPDYGRPTCRIQGASETAERANGRLTDSGSGPRARTSFNRVNGCKATSNPEPAPRAP
jgi:hypothetical protein